MLEWTNNIIQNNVSNERDQMEEWEIDMCIIWIYSYIRIRYIIVYTRYITDINLI